MTFDPATIIVTASALGVVMGCVQWLAWLHVRSEGSLAIWAATNLMFAAGLAILAMPGGSAQPLLACVNFCFLLGTGMIYLGMRTFDREQNSRWLIALVIISAASAAVLMMRSNSVVTRGGIFSLVTVIWMGASAWRLARVPPTGPAFSRLGVALFLSIFSALHLARLGAAVLGISAFFAAPVAEQISVTLMISVVCGVGLNYGALFMVLDRLASSDELTGLSNRRALLRRGQDLLAQATSQGRALSVLLVDLDHFKQVNDRFGHRVGDIVLETFAQVARTSLRPGDVIGRYGGEEFCFILPRAGALAAVAIAERLRALTQERLATVAGHPTHVTVAIGLATFEPEHVPPETIDALIDAADHALYAAKDGGRNRVVAAPSPGRQRTGRPLDTTIQPSALH